MFRQSRRGSHQHARQLRLTWLIATKRLTVRPKNLQPDAQYAVRSVDRGVLGSATGASLMTDGIDILATPKSAAHVLMLDVRHESSDDTPAPTPNRKP
jgi:hypothetical protein